MRSAETRGTLHRRLQPLYAEKHKVSCSGFLPNPNPVQPSCSHCIAFCSITWPTRISLRTWQQNTTTIMKPSHCDRQTKESRNAKNYADMNNHSLKKTEEEPIAAQTIQTAPAAHTRYLSSPAAATLHGKTRGFVLRLSPQIKPRATLMQPLQCVLQHHVANTHLFTHRQHNMIVSHFSSLCDVNSHTTFS